MSRSAIPGLCAFLANIAVLAGEPVRVPWKRAAVLVKDAEVTVTRTRTQKKVEGRVIEVRQDSIELRTPSGQASIPRSEIARIRVHGRTRGPQWALIGAAGGAATAALFAHPAKPLFTDGGLYNRNADGTSTRVDTSPHPNYGLAAAAGAGIGGVSGWFLGRAGRSSEMTIEILPDKLPADPAEAAGGKTK